MSQTRFKRVANAYQTRRKRVSNASQTRLKRVANASQTRLKRVSNASQTQFFLKPQILQIVNPTPKNLIGHALYPL